MNILVISNNDINTMKDIFIKLGHKVTIEKLSTMEKIEKINTKDLQNTDFIFVELELGKETDKELLCKLVSEFRDVPVIPVIDIDYLKFAYDIFECGIADYILKPFTNEDLKARFTIIARNRNNINFLKNKQEKLGLSLKKCGLDSLELQEEVKLAKYVQKSVFW